MHAHYFLIIIIYFLLFIDLSGVQIVAQTTLQLTKLPNIFEWPGHGIKLTVPPDSLPDGAHKCQLDIIASTAGQYQFPDHLQLVSSVFWIRPSIPGKFRRPLKVEIQHCAIITNSTKLSFVRAQCSQKTLPYEFKQTKERGLFPEHSSDTDITDKLFGSLEVTHFSGLAVVGPKNINRLYTASLYNLQKNNQTVVCHIVLSWNEETHLSVLNMQLQ